MKAMSVKSKHKECRAPDCRAHVDDPGKKFCPICQAKLDRVRQQLEIDEKDGKGRKNRHVVMPTVESLTPARAAAFDEGLKRRAETGQVLSRPERMTRAVRIVQMMRNKEPIKVIVDQLYLGSKAHLDKELAWYREQNESRAAKWTNGMKRDISTDKAILKKIADKSLTRKDIADQLGLTPPALASRIRRLRLEGHEVPDRRRKDTAAV